MCVCVYICAIKVVLIIIFQIERLLKGSFTDRQGNFCYREWVKVLRVNDNT